MHTYKHAYIKSLCVSTDSSIIRNPKTDVTHSLLTDSWVTFRLFTVFCYYKNVALNNLYIDGIFVFFFCQRIFGIES